MKLLKKLIIGTPLEAPLRALAKPLRRSDRSEWGHRVERDESNTRKLLRRFLEPDSNTVDIGAHQGLFLRQFLDLSPAGRHYAFEPLPDLAWNLSREFPRAEVFPCALSNRSGQATFYHVPEMEGWSGLRRQRYPGAAVPKEIQVELRRLDEVLPATEQVGFVKIDVEGAELEVLQGAEAILLRCRPVVLFEHAKIHNENYQTTPEMIHGFLVGQCGLEIWDLALSRTFSEQEFQDIYDVSFATNYDRNAQTNFVALAPGRCAPCPFQG